MKAHYSKLVWSSNITMYYQYPPNNLNISPLAVGIGEHTMQASLLPYLELKMHPLLKDHSINEVQVMGIYDRNEGISVKEKPNKLFNFKRPTVVLADQVAQVRCFPGWDYVFHFGNIIASYYKNTSRGINVKCILPTQEQCWHAITSSSIQYLPPTDTVIMGYVEGLEFLSSCNEWAGNGDFYWKVCNFRSHRTLLLGCKHTYWGEIAGRIVEFLAKQGVKTVIYSGKLGSLDTSHIPNRIIATGNSSRLPDGYVVRWRNLFENLDDSIVLKGSHITVPSVLQETIAWLAQQDEPIKFVDPEIGHMALAADKVGVRFSYIHVVSDNLAAKYQYDLSNERRAQVLEDRRQLYKVIGQGLIRILD